MPIVDEDDRPKKKAVHTIGEDLSTFSLAELAERIALLKDEIARIEAAVQEKSASRNAAQSIFRN
jgi:uncharacterized small protein (DUF1192 family)